MKDTTVKKKVNLTLLNEKIEKGVINKLDDYYEGIESTEDKLTRKLLTFLDEITDTIEAVKITEKTLKPKFFKKHMVVSKRVIQLCVKYMIDHDGDEEFLEDLIAKLEKINNMMLSFDGKLKLYNEKNKKMKENQYNTEEMSEGKELPNQVKSYQKEIDNLIKNLKEMYKLLIDNNAKMKLIKNNLHGF